MDIPEASVSGVPIVALPFLLCPQCNKQMSLGNAKIKKN
jgi:hypothetical protein